MAAPIISPQNINSYQNHMVLPNSPISIINSCNCESDLNLGRLTPTNVQEYSSPSSRPNPPNNPIQRGENFILETNQTISFPASIDVNIWPSSYYIPHKAGNVNTM